MRIAIVALLCLSFLACRSSEKPSHDKKSAPDAAQSGQSAQSPRKVDTGKWTSAGVLPVPLPSPGAASLKDGRVFVYGNAEQGVGAIYDPKDGSWKKTSASRIPRGNPGVTHLLDGKIMVTGGTNALKDYYVMRSAEIYDPASDTWKDGPGMKAQRRGHHQITLKDGSILAIGGTPGGFASPIRKIERYSQLTATWSRAGELAVGRAFFAVTVLPDESLLIIGGDDKDGPLASAELCPAKTKKCLLLPLPAKRRGTTLTTLRNGYVLAVGGLKGAPGTFREALYAPNNQQFIPIASTIHRRIGHTATLLRNGKVLVVGGEGAMVTETAELYDANEGSWQPTPPLSQGRIGHIAMLLKDGSVLIAGGTDNDGRAVLEVERYQPKSQ